MAKEKHRQRCVNTIRRGQVQNQVKADRKSASKIENRSEHLANVNEIYTENKSACSHGVLPRVVQFGGEAKGLKFGGRANCLDIKTDIDIVQWF